jgi:hypothetical protein
MTRNAIFDHPSGEPLKPVRAPWIYGLKPLAYRG